MQNLHPRRMYDWSYPRPMSVQNALQWEKSNTVQNDTAEPVALKVTEDKQQPLVGICLVYLVEIQTLARVVKAIVLIPPFHFCSIYYS